MLRILVISLFVANLLLLVFQDSQPAVEQKAVEKKTLVRESNIPTIHLFSEMIEDQGLLNTSRQCFSLGPFHSSEDRDQVRMLLEEVSSRIDERQTEALVEKGYWVFIPPYDSLLEANEALISLQALGLKDIGIIYDGEWKNAISMGYFMRQENAQRRKVSLENKDYAPLIRVQRQGEARYWLDYEQSPGSDRIALDMQNRPNDFMQRALPCPEEAVTEANRSGAPEPQQLIAQQQSPGGENLPGPDQAEETGNGEVVENAPQELVETLPEQASEEALETDVLDVVDTTQEEPAEAEPDIAVENTQEDPAGIESGNVEVVDQDNIEEADPENAEVTEQADPVETEPDNPEGSGQEGSGESETDIIEESGQVDTVETGPPNSVGTGPNDAFETAPESATGDENEETDGTGTG